MIRLTAIRRPPTAKLHNDPTASDPKTAKLHNDTAASDLRTAKLHNDPTAIDVKTAKLHNDTAASDLRTAKLHNDPTASDLKTAETFVTCCVRIRVMALSNYGRLSTQRCCQRKVLSLTIKRQLYFSRNI